MGQAIWNFFGTKCIAGWSFQRVGRSSSKARNYWGSGMVSPSSFFLHSPSSSLPLTRLYKASTPWPKVQCRNRPKELVSERKKLRGRLQVTLPDIQPLLALSLLACVWWCNWGFSFVTSIVFQPRSPFSFWKLWGSTNQGLNGIVIIWFGHVILSNCTKYTSQRFLERRRVICLQMVTLTFH